MATLLENLIARRDAIGVELAALSVRAAGGLPNAQGLGAGTDHVGYKDGLYRELKQLREEIAELEDEEASATDGPWEFEQAGF